MKKTLIIAEAGVNHNGSLDLAYRLIDAAIDAKADIIKFQTFKTNNIVSKNLQKAEYQKKNMNEFSSSQFDMLKKLELNDENHFLLKKYCDEKEIQFLSTPFDNESLDFLVDKIGIKLIKVASGEITNYPFLLKMSKKNLPLIISTGMSCLGEIELALGAAAFGFLNKQDKPSKKTFLDSFFSQEGNELLKKYVTLLHCTTEYPAPFEEVNLRVLETLQKAFDLNIGFSDHTNGISVPIAAVARGASVIEKHFTLSKNLEGPDHKASLEPDELKNMITSIREVEKSLGSSRKIPSSTEMKNQNIARKVLVASKNILKGDIFSEKNITVKRAGEGVSSLEYWDFLGKISKNNFQQDEVISYE